MRIDSKAEGPRQSMSWLHTWASLILGWLLYAIFLTGTLSFFQNEISVWMKPELHQSVPNNSQIQQTQIALHYLQQHAPDAALWNIQLPNSRQTSTELQIRKQGEDLSRRRGGERISLDSATGEVLQPRETRGGSFLYRFHFELYGLPRIWARWLVGVATMLMLVAIVSGIITHKKIFKDFFTFRSGKGQRSWLDAHNATAVFALPFHIMITFSGLLLLMFMFMPWGIKQVYPDSMDFFNEMRGRTTAQTTASNQNQNKGQKPAIQHTIEKIEMAPLAPMLREVQSQWRDNHIASIQITAPNTTQAEIVFQAMHAKHLIERNVLPRLSFNGVTGQLMQDPHQDAAKNVSVPLGIYNVVTVLHEARSVDLGLRWLLFFSGVMGSMMVATGLLLWCVKRAPQQQKQGHLSFAYRLVQVLNIATIIGLPLAVAGYFYANRLLPTDLDMRLNWEIRSFFTIWLLSLVFGALRPARQAWLSLLMLTGLAFACLPLLNAMTGGAALWESIQNGQWMIASFDIMSLCIAAFMFLSFYKLNKHPITATKKNQQHKTQP